MVAVSVALPPKLKALFIGPADVRGAFGGRGSAKTRSFAKMAAVRGFMFGSEGVSGIILCARQYMNSLDDSSLEEVKRAIEEELFLSAYSEVGEKYIRSRDGRISFAFAGLDKSIDSVKSKGRVLICWVDEAEPVTENAWAVLIPTLREEGSDWNAELWVTWNPKRKKSAVELRFRHSKDPLVRMVSMNWRDNPMFPAKLERDRQRDLTERPDQYDHIWEGGYVSVVEGAYFAKSLADAKDEGRISRVAFDPLMRVRVYCDLGGTGAKADAFAMWPAQFIGREIRVRDYYEAQGQQIAAHIQWLHSKGYTPEKADVYLPHDGATNDRVYDVSFESAFRAAGYTVTVIPNQGKGAARMRIEAARRMFPSIWFDADSTEPGREALGWYHEKKSEDDREIGLGPEHDWSSHGADAFGMMAVAYEEPSLPKGAPKTRDHGHAQGWMG